MVVEMIDKCFSIDWDQGHYDASHNFTLSYLYIIKLRIGLICISIYTF